MAQKDFTLIPHIVINPTSIVSYHEFHSESGIRHKAVRFIDTNENIEEQSAFLRSSRKNNGTMSAQAVRKISKAIEYLVTTSDQKKVHEKLTGKVIVFKVAFITLTLPSSQAHNDKEIINLCLNSLLNELRQYHAIKKYVWRAERQKNGNIHFHLLIDKFVPWYELRNRWNRIINKLGYVDRFQKKHGNKTPNSTDVHSTRKIHNLKKYLTKYMAKSDQTTGAQNIDEISSQYQSGRIWGCNHELSQTRGLNLIVDNEIDEELKKVFTAKKFYKYEAAYFTVYYVNYHDLKKFGSDLLFKYFSDYLFENLNYSEQLKAAI